MRKRKGKASRPHPVSRMEWEHFFTRDGPMRTVSVIIGVIIGALGAYIDLGRKLDAQTMQMHEMTVRVEAVERALMLFKEPRR